MTPLIDTHCHIDVRFLPDGADAIIERAKAAGIVGMIAIGVGDDMESARSAMSLAQRYPLMIRAAVGVHPHEAAKFDDTMFAELKVLADDESVVAIGETGLDYHYEFSPRDLQRAAFVKQIALARKLKKPIVVHTRNAAADTLEILKSEGASDVGGVIHCFSEDIAFATEALKMNFDISFSGLVTFDKAKSIQETAAWVPADRILIETDAPFLAPVPLRGKKCEPAFLVHTAKRIAELRGVTFEEIAKITSANARRRFGLKF